MIKHKLLILITAVTAFGLSQAGASFIKLPEGQDVGAVKLWFDVANHNVQDFQAFVGANNSGGHAVGIHTVGPVNTGSGFSTIKPVNGGSLTDIVFTPDSSTTFSDFSFRGQLTSFGDGTVNLFVTDSFGNITPFQFTGLGQNQDFKRQGIISEDGSFIKSVEIVSDFKELKQLEISFGDPNGTVPDGGSTVMLLGAALGSLGMARRFLRK